MGEDQGERAKAVTMFDVARRAGVSHQTVSRVINGLPNVRESTKAKVTLAIAELRYSPSTAARALASRRSGSIGLVSTGGSDYGPSSIMLSFNAAARSAGYSVSIASLTDTRTESVRAAIEQLVQQNVEAIVVVASRTAVLDAIQKVSVAAPVLVASAGKPGLRSVAIDHYRGARLAVEHLIGLGHTDIRHITGPSDSADSAARLQGWRDAIADAGLPASDQLVGDWTAGSGYRHGTALAADPPAAVFVGNDQMALGVIRALSDAGVSVPGDVSIVGYDDLPEAAYFRPGLTTVRQDFVAYGATIMSALSAILDGEEGERVPMLPSLIVRDSTAPPAAR